MSETKPTIPDVLPLVRELYATASGACGHCLHIVLDDYNVADGYVQTCIDYAIERGCEPCQRLGGLLLRMSTTQRRKLAAQKYERRA